jgi:hypothetical protein
MRRTLVLLSLGLAVSGVVSADASGPRKGTYKGHATKGNTDPSGGKKIGFRIGTVKTCPLGHNKFGKHLCLTLTAGSSFPVTCHDFNAADPKPKPVKERRGIPSLAAVSSTGHVDISIGTLGPGITVNRTRLVVTIHGNKATGHVTYTFHGRSYVISSDCDGRMEFTAKHT